MSGATSATKTYWLTDAPAFYGEAQYNALRSLQETTFQKVGGGFALSTLLDIEAHLKSGSLLYSSLDEVNTIARKIFCGYVAKMGLCYWIWVTTVEVFWRESTDLGKMMRIAWDIQQIAEQKRPYSQPLGAIRNALYRFDCLQADSSVSQPDVTRRKIQREMLKEPLGVLVEGRPATEQDELLSLAIDDLIKRRSNLPVHGARGEAVELLFHIADAGKRKQKRDQVEQTLHVHQTEHAIFPAIQRDLRTPFGCVLTLADKGYFNEAFRVASRVDEADRKKLKDVCMVGFLMHEWRRVTSNGDFWVPHTPCDKKKKQEVRAAIGLLNGLDGDFLEQAKQYLLKGLSVETLKQAVDVLLNYKLYDKGKSLAEAWKEPGVEWLKEQIECARTKDCDIRTVEQFNLL